jgi:hypothetical protein
MRRVHLCLVIIFIAILTCGCLQPAPQPAPPVTTVPDTPIPTTAPNMPRVVNFSVTQAASYVNVTCTGGPDAADMVAMNIRISNQNTQQVQRTITYPVIGMPYVFTYLGPADATVVNIVGTFRDGYQQTVLMYYF